jgi:aminoglycoside 6'-N-acetyltransferase I
MEIRKATAEDVEAWLVLRRALWPSTTEERHRAEIAQTLARPVAAAAFLATEAGTPPVGFVEVSLHRWAEGCESSPVGYLEGWYVDPTARGHRIGAALVGAAEAWARERGCTEMASDTGLGNSISHAAHDFLGYEVVAKLVCFRKRLA